MMLQPPLNHRTISPRCCESCRYFTWFGDMGGWYVCRRDPEEKQIVFDVETIYTQICDRYERKR